MNKLKECPYCHNRFPKIISPPPDGDYKVECPDCGLRTYWCRTEEEAIELWNNKR